MTLSLITNVVFAALVLIAIPGMLAWAIRTSRNDEPAPSRAVRRPMPHPSFPARDSAPVTVAAQARRGPVRDAG